MRRPQFGIRRLINVGFGSLLALGLVLTIVAVRALTQINGEVSKMDALSENSARIQDVSRDFEILRGTVQRNKLEGDDSAGKGAAQHAVQLLRAASKGTPSEERRRMYVDLEAAVGQFLDRRVALVSITRQAQAGRTMLLADGDELAVGTDRMFAAARAGANPSSMAMAARVETDILLVRVASWRFLATQDVDGETAFKANLAKARESIAALEEAPLSIDLRALVEPVKTVLDRYAANFELAAADTVKINELHDDVIVPQLSMMQSVIAAAQTSLRKDFASARNSVDAKIGATTGTQEIVGAMALLLGGLFAFWVGRGIVQPIAGMTRAMERLAAGDTGTEIPSADAGGEIGAMANAVKVFKTNAVDRARLEAEQKQNEARAATGRRTDMLRLADEFEAAVGVIVGTVSLASTELESAATLLSVTAATTQQLSTTVATASEETSSSVLSVASASRELASSVDEIARRVQESSRIAGEAVKQAQETNTRVAEQSKAATRISEVLKLITAVAEQTNLLALNATIEAARAGVAGKGFAVVAQEVKALAAQTAKAAEEIGTQISSVQATTEDSVVAIKGIGMTIDRISDITQVLAAAVEEQGVAARQIAHNVHHVAESTSQVAGNITQVNRGASQTGTASLKVLASAKSLAAESSRLNAKVETFLATVRAA